MWMLLSGCLIREDVYLRRKAELEAMEAGDDTAVGDTDCALAAFVDADGDGWGNAAYPVVVCEIADGYSDASGDCDDGDGGVFPGAVETCTTEWDDDCDGSTEGAFDAPVWYADADADGYGDVGAAVARCDADGRVADATDCDDTDDEVNPAADEVCGNGVDDDCDADGRECRLEGEFAAGDADVVWEGGVAGYASVVGDLDGDGLSDVALASEEAIHLIAAPRAGRWTLGATDVASATNDEYTTRFRAVAGDYDGDTERDVVVWSFSDVGDESAVELFLGPLRGELGGGTRWMSDVSTSMSGYGLVNRGDTDSNGRDELWVGAPRPSGVGQVALIEEGETLLTITGDVSEAFGLGVTSFDLDNDGVMDVLVSAPYANEQRGTVFGFSAPTADLGTEDAEVVIQGVFAEEGLGGAFLFIPAGDVDGDGWQDLWLPTPGHAEGAEGGGAYLVPGPLSGTVDTTDARARVFGQTNARNYGSAVTVGDVDADGLADMLIGAHGAAGDRVLLQYGPASGTYGEDDLTSFVSAGESSQVGFAPAIIGDVFGDGSSDILLFDESSGAGEGLLFASFGP